MKLQTIQQQARKLHKLCEKAGHDMFWKVDSTTHATGRCNNANCRSMVTIELDGKNELAPITIPNCKGIKHTA